MSQKSDQSANLIREYAALFISRERNRSSLITVTSATISNDYKKATIFFTVLPQDKENAVLDFLKRKRSELREFLKERMPRRNIPFVEIEIDRGEKNRQRIDEILKK